MVNIDKFGQFNSALNIPNRVNILPLSIAKSDNFEKKSFSTNPNRPNYALSQNVNNLYSPSQLLNAYSNPGFVNSLISKNDDVKKILNENGLDGKVYPENITKVSKSHLIATSAIAQQIADKMNISPADEKILKQACIFHDFGKILIPSEILEKPSELTPYEKKIMDTHAKLGAELLSEAGMNERVTNLIQNHHKPQNENTDILGQILSVADIYSALIEERSYKAPMTAKAAFDILDQKAQKGEVSTEVVNALKSSVYSSLAYAV